MRVTFITEDKVESVVEYGKNPGKYDGKATGECTSYKYIFYKSGKIHHVKIGPLQPNTTYYYRCGGNGPEFSLKTPPSSFPIEFAIVGKFPINLSLFFFPFFFCLHILDPDLKNVSYRKKKNITKHIQ